jgi:hypothetical protein
MKTNEQTTAKPCYLTGRKAIGTAAYMGGVPAVLEPFCWAWGQMVQYNAMYVCQANEYVHLDRAKISFHSWARNDLVDRFLGDWLFMLDTDHQPEPDILARLLHRMNEYDLDVIVGIYQYRYPPHPPVLYGWNSGKLARLGKWNEDAPVQTIGGAGAGCLLVQRQVFDRIKNELHEQPFDVIGQGGEDLAFFDRLKRLNIKAYFDCGVECPHLTIKPVTLKDFKRPGKHELMRIADADDFGLKDG